MVHELRNSINRKRKSNIQKAISIQIKNPSSFLSTVAYRSESYFVGVEYSSPHLHLTKVNGKWTKDIYKAFSLILIFPFPF
jgi:hypothetical protein